MKTTLREPVSGTTKASISGILFIDYARETSIHLFMEYYGLPYELAEVMYVEEFIKIKADIGSKVWAVDFAYDEDMNEVYAAVWTGVDEYLLLFPEVYLCEED